MKDFLTRMEPIRLDEYEYGFLTQDTLHSANEFHIHIPKLQSLMGFGKSKTTVVNFNNNIYANDRGACPISAGKSLTTQNYLTIQRKVNITFDVRADVKTRQLKQTQRFVIQFMNRNVLDYRIDCIL